MSNSPNWCPVQGCRTGLQDGRAGVLAHLHVVHYPHLDKTALADTFRDYLEDITA